MSTSTDATASTAERYRAFADVEASGMSATYEAWADGVATDAAVQALIDELPPPKRQPNLVFSAARLLGAEPGPYPAFAAWLAEHWSAVREVALSHATQTNEAARCALLLPVLSGIEGPIALLEVGASAGLCLYPDRYGYRYTGHAVGGSVRLDPIPGPGRGDGAVELECTVRGGTPVPVPSRMPEIVWRSGIDLNPLDVRSEADVAWLDALVWPEHDDRRARLSAAAAIAAADPPHLVSGDLNEQLAALAATAPADATLVVFHTAVLMYLDEPGRDRFVRQVGDLPGHWVSAEARRVLRGIRLRDEVPNEPSDLVLALDGVQVAWAQPHGRALTWAPNP
ncbi:DUF2332 domain-containing protein [Agromyces aureus]|uniref:DUF2332 domain-containing protein n=1 Tax=Agromyces aureus TaxID=453304 RepID=A0A191WF55_9MICO|nr:DUF2332 domain-containing protein [Agromyces aureus]ANJ26857.1 hypothetical protein ATC03_09115 [Agromyces aureus]